MKAQELKNSILQLAVEGKLVPQDSSEAPARELLKEIKADKANYSTDKRHTASPIKAEDIPYDIPESWEWVRFADIVSFSSGKTPQRQNTDYWGSPNVPWVSIADMVSDGVTIATKEKISDLALADCFAGETVPKGALLMSFKLTIGKMTILGMNAVHNEAIISIFPFGRTDRVNIIKQYLFMIMPLVAVTGDSKNAIKGKTLNSTSISNLMIPLPPLAEQKRIVARIEELLPLVSEYDAIESCLSEINSAFPDKLRKSILQQAVQGKLTERDTADEPASELLKRIKAEKERLIKEGKLKKEKPLPPIAEDEIPFEIPENWVWVRLDDLVSIHGGKRMPKGRELITTPTDHIYVRVTDMQNGTILDTDLHYVPDDVYPTIQRYIIEKEDIYIVIVGSTIGKTGLVPDKFNGMNLTENAARLTPYLIYKEYLYMSLDSNVVQVQLFDKTKQVGQPKLAIIRLRSAIIPLPPLAEQKRIVARVNELLALCDRLK